MRSRNIVSNSGSSGKVYVLHRMKRHMSRTPNIVKAITGLDKAIKAAFRRWAKSDNPADILDIELEDFFESAEEEGLDEESFEMVYESYILDLAVSSGAKVNPKHALDDDLASLARSARYVEIKGDVYLELSCNKLTYRDILKLEREAMSYTGLPQIYVSKGDFVRELPSSILDS
jgi:hypothetical protein